MARRNHVTPIEQLDTLWEYSHSIPSKMAPLGRAPAGSGTLRTQRELHNEQHSHAALFAKMNDAAQFTELHALGS